MANKLLSTATVGRIGYDWKNSHHTELFAVREEPSSENLQPIVGYTPIVILYAFDVVRIRDCVASYPGAASILSLKHLGTRLDSVMLCLHCLQMLQSLEDGLWKSVNVISIKNPVGKR